MDTLNEKISLLISAILFMLGCAEKKLPEQGHSGPTIDVQQSIKDTQAIQSVHDSSQVDNSQSNSSVANIVEEPNAIGKNNSSDIESKK